MSASAAPETSPVAGFDVYKAREDFPILGQKIHDKPLVYLDNAASTQKPKAVIEAERAIYEEYYANIHRGVHQLSMKSTESYGIVVDGYDGAEGEYEQLEHDLVLGRRRCG